MPQMFDWSNEDVGPITIHNITSSEEDIEDMLCSHWIIKINN
jgi:hypothetical protein